MIERDVPCCKLRIDQMVCYICQKNDFFSARWASAARVNCAIGCKTPIPVVTDVRYRMVCMMSCHHARCGHESSIDQMVCWLTRKMVFLDHNFEIFSSVTQSHTGCHACSDASCRITHICNRNEWMKTKNSTSKSSIDQMVCWKNSVFREYVKNRFSK